MAVKTIAVPTGIVVSVIAFLIMGLVGLVVAYEKRQDSDISVNRKALQASMAIAAHQDKALGIIAKDVENHKENLSVHTK